MMPTASARGVERYIHLKGGRKAKEFQRIRTEEWLKDNLKSISLSDIC